MLLKTDTHKIFGGYTDISWECGDKWVKGEGNSFIFSLRKDANFTILRCLDNEHEANHYTDRLCSLGGFGGFVIKDSCNINASSYSCLGDRGYYETPKDIQ